MKVLEINNFHYLRGGSETVYFNTSKLLEEKGHQVVHFGMKNKQNIDSKWQRYFVNNPNYLDSSFLGKIQNTKKFLYNKEAEEKINKLIENEKPDIAHLHLFYGGLTSSILSVLKEKNIPVVATLHDYKLLCPVYTFLTPQNEVCKKCINGNYIHCIFNHCNKNNFFYSTIMAAESYYRDHFFPPTDYISYFIFVSKFAKEIHITNRNEFKDRSSHIYNFFPKLFENKTNEVKGKYFLFYGRLSYEKGIKTLLETWGKIKEIRLKIAGTGPLQEIVLEAAKNNLDIEYLGFLRGKKLEETISNASFIIVPSEWYENNPMTIIEAYSYGKPVIGANIGGIPEIIENNRTGFLFEPKNQNDLKEKIIYANEMDEKKYLLFSQNARKFSELNFDKEEHYKKLIKIFEDLIK